MATTTDVNTFISPEELAELLHVPLGSVYRWRSSGGGPRAAKVGRHVRYRMADIQAWLEERTEPSPAA